MITKKQAKQLDDIHFQWLLYKMEETTKFKNEEDEYQQMADFINERINLMEAKKSARCFDCKCEFDYTDQDIVDESFVNCPECGQRISILE